MLSYRHQDFAYESLDEPAGEYRLDRAKKDYSRSTSVRAMRKRARSRSAKVGCGIGGRRNKSFTW